MGDTRHRSRISSLWCMRATKCWKVSWADIQGPHWDAAFNVIDALPTSNLDGVEPFGFTDGISQPMVDWERRTQGAWR